jgi:hypothetical protein
LHLTDLLFMGKLSSNNALARIIHEEVKRELYKSLSCVKIVFANRYLNTKKAFA